MIKKILITALLAITLLFGTAFAGTMSDAFSTKGNPTVGMGDTPLVHKLLYPVNETILDGVFEYLIDNGEFVYFSAWRIGVYRMTLEDGTIVVYVMRLHPLLPYIFEEEVVLGYHNENVPEHLVSAVVVGNLFHVEHHRGYYPIVAVVIPGHGYAYVMDPDNTPSIYSTMWRKTLWKLYIEKINQNWHNEMRSIAGY